MRAARGGGVHSRAVSARWAALLVGLVLPLAGCAKDGQTETAGPWLAVSSAVSAPSPTPTRPTASVDDPPTPAIPATPPTAATPDGSGSGMVGRRVTARRAGVSFEVPAGWRAIDPALATSGGAAALPDAFRALAEQSGQTADEFLRRIGTLMDVLVMGPPSHGFADNVSVIPTPAPLPSPGEMRDQLEMAGAAVASVDRVSTPLGAVLLARSRITIGTKVVASRSIAVELDGRLSYITVSASDWDKADSIADGILRTLGRA